MENENLTLDLYRNQLAEEVIKRGDDLPCFDPMDINPWLAMSLMQKAIRRGRGELALPASATLLRDSPERFWRRICVTAYEDIGLADFDTVAVVTSSLKGKRWRSHIGGEWAVASYLVNRMANTIKCRAADDLAVICQFHPSLKDARRDLPIKSISVLIEQVTGNNDLIHRALALWFAVGTNRCRSPVLKSHKGDPQTVFDALRETNIPDNVVEIAWEGFKKSNSILCPFLILLWPGAQQTTSHVEPDELPEEKMIRDVPCWAYDVHVREGNQALARFLKTDCATTRWIVQHVPRKEQFRILGSMLFRVESGLVNQRLRWKTGDQLRQMADLETGGVDPRKMEIGLQLLRQDLPKLHEARCNVLKRA